MAQHEQAATSSNAARNCDRDAMIMCKLFSDRVSIEVCTVRRMELDQRGGFSCTGCPAAASRDRFGAAPPVRQLP
jgi:hypothetical protein